MSGMIPDCSHLDSITVTELPAAVDGCEECLGEVAMIIPEVPVALGSRCPRRSPS